MKAFFALALLASIQEEQKPPQGVEKQSLAWIFKVGESKEFGWKGRMKVEGSGAAKQVSGTDSSMQMRGTFDVLAEEADGSATGNLLMHYQLIEGKFQGRELKILVEDGKVKNLEGAAAGTPQKQVDAILAPAKVRITKRGNLEFLAPHPLSDGLSGIWPPMGPILPSKKRIAVGESWLVPLQPREWKALDLPAVNIEFSFKEMGASNDRKCAHITVNAKQMVRVGTAELNLDIKDDAFFDMAQGECVQDKSAGTISMSGSGWTWQAEFTWQFETLPPKKR